MVIMAVFHRSHHSDKAEPDNADEQFEHGGMVVVSLVNEHLEESDVEESSNGNRLEHHHDNFLRSRLQTGLFHHDANRRPQRTHQCEGDDGDHHQVDLMRVGSSQLQSRTEIQLSSDSSTNQLSFHTTSVPEGHDAFVENDAEEESDGLVSGTLDAKRQPLDHRVKGKGQEESNRSDPMVVRMWFERDRNGRIFLLRFASNFTTFGFSTGRHSEPLCTRPTRRRKCC